MKESHPLVQRQLAVQKSPYVDFRVQPRTIFENSSSEIEAPNDAGEVEAPNDADKETLTSGPEKPDEDAPPCSDQVPGEDNTAKANATEDCGKSLEEAPGFVFKAMCCIWHRKKTFRPHSCGAQ